MFKVWVAMPLSASKTLSYTLMNKDMNRLIGIPLGTNANESQYSTRQGLSRLWLWQQNLYNFSNIMIICAIWNGNTYGNKNTEITFH